MSDLRSFLDEYRDLPQAHLLETVLLQITGLGDDVHADVEPLAVRVRVGASPLCEVSIYGQLFIVRCGPSLAVEYRVRDEDVAWRALDQVLREYMLLRDTRTHAVP